MVLVWGLKFIDFTSNDTGTGVLSVPSGIQTAGAPPFPIAPPPSTVVQFSYATSLTFPVVPGATWRSGGRFIYFLLLDFGRVRLYNDAGLSEIV